MKRKVGSYMLGLHMCDLYITSGSDGSGQFPPNNQGKQKICVGGEQSWRDCVGTLLHEAMECELWSSGCAFMRQWSMSEDTAGVMFMADHRQFDEACVRAGHFVSQCLLPLRKAHDAHDRDMKAKARQKKKASQ